MSDPYAVDARFYDLVHGGRGDEDALLWQSFAGRTERPVLEVGTGTGRVALQLALAGHAVTGLDPSAAMLAIARDRAAEAGLDVRFVEGRAGETCLERGHYGFIVVPADVFLHCAGGEEQRAVLRALGEALAFNGVLALDLPGPAAWLDPTGNGQPLLAWSGRDAEGLQLDVWHVREDDLAEQTRWLRVAYEQTGDDGTVRRWQSEHRLRYVYRFETECLLALSGLTPEGVYGGYDLEPLANESERMIVIARRQRG
ncbi:MAG: class I SAM-dependent methyltransferase [Dehalococcoidia bacterium]|nr:class I SAM-dependent methyltransferase [Dehalococcoidia bacterium]